MKIRNLEDLMEVIEDCAGECKIEVHRVASLNYAQQMKIALAFEAMLDGIEDAIRANTGPT